MKRGDLIIFHSKNYSPQSGYSRRYAGRLYIFLRRLDNDWVEVLSCEGVKFSFLFDDLELVSESR